MDKQDPLQRLWRQLKDSDNIAEVHKTLEEVSTLVDAGELTPAHAHDLRSDAFCALQQLTQDSFDEAKPLILDDLIPFCLISSESEPEGVQRARRRARQCLSDWIDQYPEPDRSALRSQVLDRLYPSLQTSDPTSVLYTIAAIGFREPTIVDSLWDLVERHDDQTGDRALYILVSLGVPSHERPQLLDVLHRRASDRYNLSLLAAVRQLADPASLDVVETHWFRSSDAESWRSRGNLVLTVLTDVADEMDNDLDVQDRVWTTISSLYVTHPDVLSTDLSLGSHVAPRCDSPHVVPALLTWLSEVDGDTKRAAHTRWLYYLRLEQCVRPSQMLGWEVVPDPQVVTVLHSDVCLDTQHMKRMPEASGWRKEKAWNTLLCLGYSEALAWFETSVACETNPFLRRQIMNRLACFRLDPLPPTLRHWVTEPYSDRPADASGEWSYRTAAIRLAQSAASREAFEVLRNFGLTIEGSVTKQSIDALAEVTVHLARIGDTTVVDDLVDSVVDRERPDHHRIAAAGALELVASEGLLATHHASRLMAVTTDQDRDLYERSSIVGALGHLEVDVPPGFLKNLVAWSQEEDNWLGGYSVETLARWGNLFSEPDLLINQLGLQSAGYEWDALQETARNQWAPHIIGLLYRERPTSFTPAVASLLVKGDWTTAVQLIYVLRETHGDPDQPSLPSQIRQALLQRICEQQTTLYAEPELFAHLARLAPDALVETAWEELWADWLADARMALADALGRMAFPNQSSRARAERLLLLLAKDPVYAVRRSAYRGLAQVALGSFEEICAGGSYYGAPMERRHQAAEACEWLPLASDGQSAIFNDVYARLGADPEPSVRQTARDARRSRRKRLWAEEYLTRIRAVDGFEKDDVLAVWRYGKALAQIGDDACLSALRTDLATRTLPPNVRFWLESIVSELEAQWQKITQKWPDPWFTWRGQVRQGQAVMRGSDGQESKVHYSLWYEPAPVPPALHSWGGALSGFDHPFSAYGVDRFTLRLEDGTEGEAISKYISGGIVVFAGTGSYPT